MFDLDQLISKLLSVKNHRPGKQVHVSQDEIISLLELTKAVLMKQPVMLDLSPPLTICGDIHGQYWDLLHIFDISGYPPDTSYLFLGDYVDRGRNSIEVTCILFAYKVKYADKFYLIRGNHETEFVNENYGFKEECERRYNLTLWKKFNTVFDCLPLAALIEDKIFCCHGGLSPELDSLDQIRAVSRPVQIPQHGLLCDLMWADPHPDPKGRGFRPNPQRGISYIFGADILKDFLEANNLQFLVRAHDCVDDGFQFFGKWKGVTVFSAPNYAGLYDNCGAIMNIKENLECTFQILKHDSKLNPATLENGRKLELRRTYSDIDLTEYGRQNISHRRHSLFEKDSPLWETNSKNKVSRKRASLSI